MTAVPAATTKPARRVPGPRPGRDSKLVLLYLAPAFLVMGVITFFPLAFQVFISFTDFTIGSLRTGNAPWVGLDNYVRILENNLAIPNFYFFRQVLYNLWWALANVAVHVVLGVAIALLLNAKGLRFKTFPSLRASCRARPSGGRSTSCR